MPVGKLSIQDFAAKIKAKYPSYKDVNDTLLTQKIIDKYPEYKDMVNYQVAQPAPIPKPEHEIDHTTIQDVRHLNEMSNRETPDDQQMVVNPETGIPEKNTAIEDENKKYQSQFDTSIKELGTKLNTDPDKLKTVIGDFSEDHDENSIQQKARLKDENPETYERLKTADQNKNLIAKKSIHDANAYNQLQGSEEFPIQNLDQLTRNIQNQKEIILSNLSGEDRGKALANLERNRAASFNSENPEIQNEYANNEDLKNVINLTQYAGLKSLQAFDPEKAASYAKLLKPIEGPVDEYLDAKIGKEKILKELLDIGRNNTIRSINEKQYDLDKAWKGAQTQEEKDEIAQQFLKNKATLDDIYDDSKKDVAKFPYMKDLEFENQVRELTQDPDQGGFLGYAANSFAHKYSESVNAVENLYANVFGNEKDLQNNQLEALGEGARSESSLYLPENYRNAAPQTLKFDKSISDAAKAIQNDPNLTDKQKHKKLYDLVAENQDKIETITNPEYGKSANFFSKATLYKNAGTVGDIAAIAAQQYMMGKAGASRLISNTVPMYLTTQNEFYREAIEKGISNPMAYANTHASILMTAGLINPDLGIVKKALGNKAAEGVMAGISESTWNEVVAANKPIINRIKNSLVGVGKEAAKIGLTYGAGTSIAQDLTDRGFFNKNIDYSSILGNAVKATKEATIGSIAILGLHGITNFKTVSPEEKARIWEIGDNPQLANEEIDDAVKKGDISQSLADQRKAVIKNISKLIKGVPTEDAKGRPMTDQQRSNYLYNQLLKTKIDEIKADLPDSQKDKLEAIKTELDIDNNAIIDPKSERENLMQRKRELTEELEPAEDGSSNLTPLEKKTRQGELDKINERIEELNKPQKPRVTVSTPNIVNVKLKKTTDNAIQEQSTGEMGVREQEAVGEGVGSGDTKSEIPSGEGQPKAENKDQNEEDWPFVDEPGDNEVTSIKNKVTAQKIQEYGLTPALQEAKRALPEVWDEAVKKINKGYDPQHLIDGLKKKPRPITDTEDALLLYHQATKEAELESINKEINESYEKGNQGDFQELQMRKARVLDELQDIYDVDKKVGTANARGLNARKMMVDRRFSLVNMMAEKRAAQDGTPLSTEEQAAVEKQFSELKEAKEKVDKRLAELEAENESLKNKSTPEPEEVKEKEKKPRKSKAERSTERKNILNDIRNDLLKAAKGGGGLTSSIPMAAQLAAIAPHIPKLVRNLVDSGIDTLQDVTKEIVGLLKQDIQDITENHVYDLIAGEFKAAIEEKQLTPEQEKRKQLAEKRAEIKKQAKKAKYLVSDPALLKLRADYERKKASWSDDLKRLELAKRTKLEKAQDTFVKWQRAFKLSGITTLAKLAMAGASRLVLSPVEEVVGGVYSKVLPKGITRQASGEGGLNVKAEARAISRAFSQGMKDSWDILRKKTRGQSDIEAVFGKGHELPPEAIGFFGQLHSAIKAPVKRAAFERSLEKRFAANIKNGVDVTDPMVQTKIAVQAYKDAQRAIFMQDNFITDAYRKAINSLEKSKQAPVIGKGFATGLQWLIPFVKVPTNIVGEVQRHTTGIPEGVVRLAYQAMKNGLKDVSEDEADAIMRAFKKGSLGAGALAIGFFNPNSFGGFYHKEDKKSPDKLKPGSAKVMGVTIPIEFLESPFFQTMQLGATIRKMSDEKLTNKPKALTPAILAGELDLLGHEPLIEQPERIASLFTKPSEREYFLGEMAKGAIVPAAISNIAKMTDKEESRKPEGILEHIETGIPGLRQTIPTKEQAKANKKKEKSGRRGKNTGHK